MAKPQTLIAEERARTGSGVLKQMRREGYIPSVVYGGGSDNKNVKVHAKTFRDMLNNAASDSILVTLDLGDSNSQLAFLQDVQQNAITGEPEGVKAGGLLEQMLHSLDISCLPKDLPEGITADVSALEIGDALHISEVNFPEGVTPTLGGDVVVAIVAKTRTAQSEDDEEGEGEGEAAEGEAAEGEAATTAE